jgi:hypothetical protein
MRYIYLAIFSISLLSGGGGILPVDWSKVTKSQQKTSAPYPKVLTEGIKDTLLPVYLSKEFAYDENMVVVAEKNFYTISMELKEATLSFEGDRTFQESVSPDNPEFQKIVKHSLPVEYLASEGMMTAQYSKNGINYAINLECEEPKKDKRCTETTFIKRLYNTLVMVGGRP